MVVVGVSPVLNRKKPQLCEWYETCEQYFRMNDRTRGCECVTRRRFYFERISCSWCVCWFNSAAFNVHLAGAQCGRGSPHRHGVVDSRVVHAGARRVLCKAPLEQLQRLGHLLVEILCRLIGDSKVKVVRVESARCQQNHHLNYHSFCTYEASRNGAWHLAYIIKVMLIRLNLEKKNQSTDSVKMHFFWKTTAALSVLKHTR